MNEPVGSMTPEQLRAELARTRPAFAEYVQDVGAHPDHAGREVVGDARRHLDVREELDRRGSGVVPRAAADPSGPPADAETPTNPA